VRRAFRQAMRYYLDMVRLPGRSQAELAERLVVETPGTVEDAFGHPGPMVFASMHFGAVEFPALFAVARTGRRITAPMETLADPELQAWISRTRSSVGVDLVGLRDARRALTATLDEGGTVGMVVDRNVAGWSAASRSGWPRCDADPAIATTDSCAEWTCPPRATGGPG
jgi:lauroyl/myristoyl acyltransferase